MVAVKVFVRTPVAESEAAAWAAWTLLSGLRMPAVAPVMSLAPLRSVTMMVAVKPLVVPAVGSRAPLARPESVTLTVGGELRMVTVSPMGDTGGAAMGRTARKVRRAVRKARRFIRRGPAAASSQPRLDLAGRCI